jgi:predicted TPR repeat methyltransferase
MIMTDTTASNLDSVYAAKGAAEVAAKYDSWAEGYDAEMAGLGYRHPTICLSMLTRYLPRGEGPILDAGAGTGLLGEWMAITGYPAVEALDISEGMLAVARGKGVYDRLHRAALGESLPFPDDHFAAVVSAGVFTTGHVGAEGFDELIRITRPGGVLVLTIKDTLWNKGVGARISELAQDGTWDILEETPSYVSMPNRPDTVPSRAVVLKVK